MRFKARSEQAVLVQHPRLQLDADKRVKCDVVTESTVSVPEHSPVSPVDQARVGLAECLRILVLVVLRTAVLHHVPLALAGEPLQGGGQVGVEVAGVNHGDSDRIELHAPLALVELEVVQQELLGDVAEPGVVSLQCGTLQAGLPELYAGLAVSVTDGTVVVLVSHARHRVGHRQRAHRVTVEAVPLAPGLHIPRAGPVRGTGVSDVEVAVLPQMFTTQLPVVLGLLFVVKIRGVNTAVPVLSTQTVAQTVPLPPVQLQRRPGVSAQSAGILLGTEFPSFLDGFIIPGDGGGGVGKGNRK